jgi:hypothetical protein
MLRALCAVAALELALLLVRASRVGLAGDTSTLELTELARAHPDSDFLLPAYLAPSTGTHDAVGAGDHVLLLSRTPVTRASPPGWTCRL